jgi:hypothetical protein
LLVSLGCQVSKHTFLAALKERGAVLFCPGGQAEMVHAWKAFLPEGKRELVLHTRHRGFCRCVLLSIYQKTKKLFGAVLLTPMADLVVPFGAGACTLEL